MGNHPIRVGGVPFRTGRTSHESLQNRTNREHCGMCNSCHEGVSPMSEGAEFIPAKTLRQYQSPLLRLSAANGSELLHYQSSLLRLWADTAPWPWFQYQR